MTLQERFAEQDKARKLALAVRLAEVLQRLAETRDALFLAEYLLAHCDEFSISNMLANQPKP